MLKTDFISTNVQETVYKLLEKSNQIDQLNYYFKIFNENGFEDWNNLIELTLDQLIEIGIKPGHIGIFQEAIKQRTQFINDTLKELQKIKYEFPPKFEKNKIRFEAAQTYQLLIKQNFKTIINYANKGLTNLEVPIKICFLSIFCRENIMLFGPPGTGKTFIAERIAKMLNSEETYFYALLTKFTTPEEIFGNYSISKLKQDKLERQTKGYLPSANICVLDEVFKSSSAVLNTLLKVLNERKFQNDGEDFFIPLQSVFGATNEQPNSDLNAFYDRFLLRFWINRLNKEQLKQFINSDNATNHNISKDQFPYLTWDAIALLNMSATSQIIINKLIITFIFDLIVALRKEEFEISDRRIGKALNLLKIIAYLSDDISIKDCEILKYIFCDREEQLINFIEIYQRLIQQYQALYNLLIPSKTSYWLSSDSDEWEEQIPQNLQKKNNQQQQSNLMDVESSNQYLIFSSLVRLDINQKPGYLLQEQNQTFCDNFIEIQQMENFHAIKFQIEATKIATTQQFEFELEVHFFSDKDLKLACSLCSIQIPEKHFNDQQKCTKFVSLVIQGQNNFKEKIKLVSQQDQIEIIQNISFHQQTKKIKFAIQIKQESELNFEKMELIINQNK